MCVRACSGLQPDCTWVLRQQGGFHGDPRTWPEVNTLKVNAKPCGYCVWPLSKDTEGEIERERKRDREAETEREAERERQRERQTERELTKKQSKLEWYLALNREYRVAEYL